LKLTASVRKRIRELHSDQPVNEVRTMEELVSNSVSRPRFYTVLLGVFGGLALLLAAAGVYGVMSYSVSQRHHEIGIRMALGARPTDVLKLVVSQGARYVVIGLAIGLGGAFAATRLLSSLLYGTTPTDPPTFAVISLLLLAVALAAIYVPAHRASRVDPMVALRHE
jgi:putative ABC transport system permease protein